MVVLAVVIKTLLVAVVLWLALKVTKTEGDFLAMLAIGFISTLLGFIPMLGFLLSVGAIVFLLDRWTSVYDLREAAFVGAIAYALSWVLGFAIFGMLTKLG